MGTVIRNAYTLLLGAILTGMLIGCSVTEVEPVSRTDISSNVVLDAANISSASEQAINKLEIYHFHGTHQCYSCKTVGEYAEETVSTYFAEELKSGMIVFGHINGDLPENRELVAKYGIKSSSLWLGVYDETGFHPEENVNVWYKIKDKEQYMSYLKSLIEKRLAGDFS